MMTNNGGFQSNYPPNGGGGAHLHHAQTYNPTYPNNYPRQHHPNYPPQQPPNYGYQNTYNPPPPSNYPPPGQYPPPYGHTNTFTPPPNPYPPQPYPPSGYGRANTYMPPPAYPPPAPLVKVPTAPVSLPAGILPYPTNFNAERDCQILHSAVHGAGTDERAIINIIVNRNGLQRQEIRRCYKASYGKDLIKRLKDDTSGNFKDVVAGMFMTPAEYDATCLYKAMKGIGTNEGVLIEIIGTRTPQQLMVIKNAFKQIYNEDLEKWIKDDTSFNFKKMLVALLQCNRSMNPTPNLAQCQVDAQALYNAGEGRLGTDESTFIRIFANRSPAEMIMINKCYMGIRPKGLYHAIEKEFSGDIRKLLQTVLEGLMDTPSYYAKRIRDSVKGLGTNDSRLVRVIVSRSEIDLGLIKQAYRANYGRDMLHDVRDDTSGYYREILTGLISRC